MKKLKTIMDRYVHRLNESWKSLPVGKQKQYTIYFFILYLLLTAVVILKVWYDTKKSGNNMVIEHIENPVPKK
jgi:hypothetical protein